MATIYEKTKDKKIISYKFQACIGRDEKGKQIFKCTTWTPPPELTNAKSRKAAKIAADEWEKQVKQEFLLTQNGEREQRTAAAPEVNYTLDGLLYAGHSENFVITIILHNDKFAVPLNIHSPFDLLAFNRNQEAPSTFDVDIAVGYVYYVRPEYVDKVYYDEDGSRIVSLKLGNEIETCINSPWELMPDVDPYDFPM